MEILIGALFLSIWHSILFWNQEIGISAILFAIPVIGITIKLLKGKMQNQKALLISIPIILLSSTYFIFDNPVFQKLNIIIIPILYVIMIIIATSQTSMKSMFSKIMSMIIEPFNYFGEVFGDVKKQVIKKLKIEKQEKQQKPKQDIVKAIFFTIMIVLIVLGLLISADSEFAQLFQNILKGIENLSVPELIIRIGVGIALFLYIASFFINMLSSYNVLNEYEKQEVKSKESLTIHMILTTLNIIYLVFCYIQIKSLITIENIKYSEYAREGFFQLMIVSLINFATILKATNKNLIETEKQKKYKKLMCIIMLVFTLVIIISSLLRMYLYQQNYGDTRLRILVNFTLITEIILLIPTAIYIIKTEINLAKTYFVIITVMYCIINFINIDNMIAKNNIDRYIETGKIDLRYLTNQLDSTDVIEELLRLQETQFKYTKDSIFKLSNVDHLNTYLSNKLKELDEKITLPEFNLSRYRAKINLEGMI